MVVSPDSIAEQNLSLEASSLLGQYRNEIMILNPLVPLPPSRLPHCFIKTDWHDQDGELARKHILHPGGNTGEGLGLLNPVTRLDFPAIRRTYLMPI
jgi:hypothetical protein